MGFFLGGEASPSARLQGTSAQGQLCPRSRLPTPEQGEQELEAGRRVAARYPRTCLLFLACCYLIRKQRQPQVCLPLQAPFAAAQGSYVLL